MLHLLQKRTPKPTVEFLKDSIAGNKRYLKLRISPNRAVNRYDIFANKKMVFYNLRANGATYQSKEPSLIEKERNY
jgi:hypothetical protein